MATDEQIAARLREFLKTSDLTTTTTAIVRRRLEEDLGIDLSDKKAFVREQVDLFLQSQVVENGKEEEEEVEVDGEGCESEEEEREEEDERSNGYKTRKRGSRKIKAEVKRKGGGGFCKVCSLSPQLQEFTGTGEMARTEVVKLLWVYIKEKNLQDPSNKRNILCDEKLRELFKVDCINMFQMNKVLAKHIWPLESDEATPVKPTPKEKKPKKETEEEVEGEEEDEEPKRKGRRKKGSSDEDNDESKRKGKRQKGGNSGFLAPLKLSDALVKFLGTGESELARSQVVKRIWDYIKEKSLQDPSDKRQITCDEKLKELFEVDSFHGFTVSKLLKAHLTKVER
uniref:Uncharacterized protein n=1 Tax=Kalanchoe fedtschenkoi TaxID=63787 RepID=A0A7N0UEK0_KALFE